MGAAKGSGSVYKTEQGWRGAIAVNGRRRYVSGPTKTIVAQKLREIQRQAEDGFVQTGRTPKLGEWIDHWMTATEGKHTIKTHDGYTQIVERYLPGWLAQIPLNKLEPEQLEEAYSDLTKKKLSGSTIYQLHSVIRASLSLAVKRGRVPTNAAKLVVDPPSSKPAKVKPFSNADLDRIYEVLEDQTLRPRWHLALELGPRPGEAIAIEWPHINFADGSIRIEQQLQVIDKQLRLVHYTKARADSENVGREIPLLGHIADQLRTLRKTQLEQMASPKWNAHWHDVDEKPGTAHAFVFTSQRRLGQPINPIADYRQWHRILTAAGLPLSKPYRARHTAASNMIAAGIDLTVVAEILGHADINMLIRVYAHAIEERKKAAGTVLEAAFATLHADKLSKVA